MLIKHGHGKTDVIQKNYKSILYDSFLPFFCLALLSICKTLFI